MSLVPGFRNLCVLWKSLLKPELVLQRETGDPAESHLHPSFRSCIEREDRDQPVRTSWVKNPQPAASAISVSHRVGRM